MFASTADLSRRGRRCDQISLCLSLFARVNHVTYLQNPRCAAPYTIRFPSVYRNKHYEKTLAAVIFIVILLALVPAEAKANSGDFSGGVAIATSYAVRGLLCSVCRRRRCFGLSYETSC
jgi:hypothetical protein